MNSLQVTAGRSFRPSRPALLFLGLAVGLGVLAVAIRDPLPALLALLPLAWALVVSSKQWRPFQAELDWDALRLPGKPEYRWDEFWALRFNGRGVYPEEIRQMHGQIQLVHRLGIVELPKYLDPPAAEVYRVVWSFLAEPRNPPVIPAFEEWVTQQRATFGQQLVQVFGARTRRWSTSPETRTIRRLAAAGIGVGGLWLALAWAPGFPANLAWIGGITAGISLFVWLISLVHTEQRAVPNWQQSMLVVSPAGFALQQGKLSGVLKWEELRKLSRHNHGLSVAVDGATFSILDIYDRPLAVIQRQLERNWRPQQLPKGPKEAASEEQP